MKMFRTASGLIFLGLILLIGIQGCKKDNPALVNAALRPSEAAIAAKNKIIVSTYAGCGQGYLDGPVNRAMFNLISQIVAGPDGNLYVGDYNVIRKISKDGMVSTVAGCYTSTTSLDGQGLHAYFTHIVSLTITPWGTLFASDKPGPDVRRQVSNLRQITPDGFVSTLETLLEEEFDNYPVGPVSFGPDSSLYVMSPLTKVGPIPVNSPKYRIVSPGHVLVTYDMQLRTEILNAGVFKSMTVGRDGAIYLMTTDHVIYKRTLQDAVKNYPTGGLGLSRVLAKGIAAKTVTPDTSSIYRDALAVAADGTVYFTDGLVIRVLHTDGHVTVLAGGDAGYVDGPANQAKFENIMSLELADNDTVLYVADNYLIRKITLK